MDWMKLDSSFDDDQLKGIFSRVLSAETKGNTLSAHAKEMPYASSDGEFLAGIILDTGDEKQYVRFVRKNA